MSIIEPSTAIQTSSERPILMGNPTTSRLNWGIVFISMPKMMSESRERATMGKATEKPIRKRWPIACIR